MKSSVIHSIALFLAIGNVAAAPLAEVAEVAERDNSQCPIVGPPTYGLYEYVGCMTEASSSRTLDLSTTSSSEMTLEVCAAYCASKGLPLMGTEYSSECYCGTYPRGDAVAARDTECNMDCGGDPFEVCGGPSRLSLYAFKNYTAPIIPAISGYTYQGCYTEPSSVRALASASYADYTGMTVGKCQSFCSAKGYSIFGLEYAGECWCANSLASASVLATGGDSECTSTCPGDYTQLACGASSRLSVYKKD